MQRPSRGVPALFFLVTFAGFLWIYDNYTAGDWTPGAAFILPPVAVMAVGGLVEPRLLWSVGPRRHSMPKSVRIAGAILFSIGLAISAALLVWAPKL